MELVGMNPPVSSLSPTEEVLGELGSEGVPLGRTPAERWSSRSCCRDGGSEKEIQMADLPIPKDIEAFMADPNPAVVATVRSDGSPHSVATWYEWDGGVLLLNMDRSRKRLRHLSPGSPVALCVMARSDW